MSRMKGFFPKPWGHNPDRDMLDFFREPFSFFREQMQADVQETEDEVIVDVELPGFKKDQITIELGDRSITVMAEKREEVEEKDDGKRYYRRERNYGNLQRTIFLPADVKEEGAKAKFEDGLLTVVLKKEHPQLPKTNRIPIE